MSLQDINDQTKNDDDGMDTEMQAIEGQTITVSLGYGLNVKGSPEQVEDAIARHGQ